MHIHKKAVLCLLALVTLLLVSCNRSTDYSRPEEFLERSYEVLQDYSYYRDRIPGDPFQYNTPAELYYSIADVLRGGRYTFFVEAFDLDEYLGKFVVGDTRYYFGMQLDVLPGSDGGGDTLFCSQVFHGSGAEAAGLKVGDKLVAVDSFPLYGNKAVFDAVTTHANDTVSVSIVRVGDSGLDTLTVFKGAKGAPVSYSAKLTDSVGYIYLSTFMANGKTPGGSSSAQFLRSLEETDTFPVTIIDLRGNGGGYVSQADTIASYFLDAGDTVIVTNAPAPSSQVHKDMVPTVLSSSSIVGSRKFVLLSDGGSASASEILITALRYNASMPLVGSTTYGKAIGQVSLFLLENSGADTVGAAHVTVAKYFAPDGTTYEETGISPDVEIGSTVTAFEDPQLAKAVEVAEGLIGATTRSGNPVSASIAHYNASLPKPSSVIEFEMQLCDN